MKWNDLKGKTIERVSKKFANTVELFFTDGTSAVIDTEAIGHGLYSPSLHNPEEYLVHTDVQRACAT